MKDLEKISFADKASIEFVHKGLCVFVSVDRERGLLTLSSPIFTEKTYLPPSVVSCVEKSQKAVKGSFPSYLTMHEEVFSVSFIQHIPLSSKASIFQLITSFRGIASFWGKLLKKLAEKDLMYKE